MKLRHVGLACSSEERADRFYVTLLRLTKSRPKTLPAGISSALFGIDAELRIINYTGDSIWLEVFIHAGYQRDAARIDHVCIEVDGLESFLRKAHELRVEIIQVPKGDSTITFVKDFDGNSFEVKAT